MRRPAGAAHPFPVRRRSPGSRKINKSAHIKAESADRAATLAPEKAAKKRAALAADKSGKTKRSNPQLYLNRELAQLEFNRRVLAQAEDADVPVLERLRFLCIVSSNLDEFFEIRVAGLKAQIELGADTTGPDGATPSQAFKEVSALTHELVARQYQLWNEELLPQLAREGIRFLRRRDWTDAQKTWIKAYLPEGDHADDDSDRTGPGASVPSHPQQEPQFRRAVVRQGRVRPQFRSRIGAGARACCRG